MLKIDHMNPKGKQFREKFTQILAVIGFITVLLFGLWGTVQVVKLIPSVLSNLASVTSFTSIFIPNEKITIDLQNSLISSGNEFKLKWKHKGRPENSSYSFNYACKEGLTFQTEEVDEVFTTLLCDSPFLFNSDDNFITLTPVSNKIRFVDVPVVITSINESGESTTLGDALLTITNEAVSGSSLSTSSDTSDNDSVVDTGLTAGERVDQILPISDSRYLSDQSGRVDLVVNIIDTGIINSDNVFVPTSPISATKHKGAIRFSVTNIGSKTSDKWTFNTVLPTFPMHIFHSTGQKALNPGDRIDFTLGFDQLNQDLSEGVITVNVDPSGSIYNEINRNNNIAQVTIKIVK